LCVQSSVINWFRKPNTNGVKFFNLRRRPVGKEMA
jgi:hypothetical protein